MDTNTILDPVEEYKMYYKKAIVDNATSCFENLATKSSVSESVNKEIIKRLRKAEAVLEKHTKKSNSIKGWRIFLTIILVACVFTAGITIFLAVNRTPETNFVGLVCGAVISILVFIGGVCLDILYIKKRLKHFQKLIEEARKKVQMIQDEAYHQMSPLYQMFDWRLTLQLVEQTCPIIHLDEVFDVRKLDFLIRNYDFHPVGYDDIDHSILDVMSGTMADNPFLIVNQLSRRMGTKIYTGSILNTYTEWETVGDKRQLVTKTETLIANVSKPCPYWDTYNYIVYGNEAGDKLIFNRIPSGVDGDDSDKKIDKIVRKGSKKLDKIEKRAMNDNDPNTNFTKMGNEKFDVLFGATDRNNEVEFRLLFTPSVQVNMTKLITDGLYGDDFTFNKRCAINIIYSTHSQGFDYSCNYTNYIDIEYVECRRKFVEYNVNFFNCLYFDLAPLLAITLYQSTKPRFFNYKNQYDRRYTSYEDEAMANRLGYSNFGGAGFDTRSMLKSKFLKRTGDTDYSLITSHSYTITQAVEFVPVLGRDGYMHDVPVTYDVYTPISKDTVIGLARFEGSEQEYSAVKTNKAFQDFLSRLGNVGSIIKNRGLLGFIVGDPSNATTDYDLQSLYNTK